MTTRKANKKNTEPIGFLSTKINKNKNMHSALSIFVIQPVSFLIQIISTILRGIVNIGLTKSNHTKKIKKSTPAMSIATSSKTIKEPTLNSKILEKSTKTPKINKSKVKTNISSTKDAIETEQDKSSEEITNIQN